MKLYNSMTKSKQEFNNREKDIVKIFSCGPSVYDKPHIGNYRTFLYEDLLQRYLEYKGYKVTRAQNLTDYEDKAVTAAIESHNSLNNQTAPAIKSFESDMKLLKIKKPIIVRATESVDESINIIQKLLDKKIAYIHNGEIYFDPMKTKKFGKLFGLDLTKWPKEKRRFSKDTYNGNRWNLGDFILWHKADDDSKTTNALWNSPWGKGRPSWHVQDPAIVFKTLGDQIDINCGGIDNIFGHHDYNIAVMEATSGKEYANFYTHGAHLFVDGKKMSKSKCNVIYPQDLNDKGISGVEIRFFLLATTHYRNKLNFTIKSFEASLAKRKELLKLYDKCLKTIGSEKTNLSKKMLDVFEESMDDDLSLANAIDGLINLFKEIKSIHTSEKKLIEQSFNKINEVINIK